MSKPSEILDLRMRKLVACYEKGLQGVLILSPSERKSLRARIRALKKNSQSAKVEKKEPGKGKEKPPGVSSQVQQH
jgi:hypothetical protein